MLVCRRDEAVAVGYRQATVRVAPAVDRRRTAVRRVTGSPYMMLIMKYLYDKAPCREGGREAKSFVE